MINEKCVYIIHHEDSNCVLKYSNLRKDREKAYLQENCVELNVVGILTTGLAAGARARTIGRANAETTIMAVMNQPNSFRGDVLPEPSFRLHIFGRGAST